MAVLTYWYLRRLDSTAVNTQRYCISELFNDVHSYSVSMNGFFMNKRLEYMFLFIARNMCPEEHRLSRTH